MGFKNYFNSHKQELMREIEHVQKLSLKDKLFTALGANLSKNLQATLDPPKFQYQGELEKYIDIDLNLAK